MSMLFKHKMRLIDHCRCLSISYRMHTENPHDSSKNRMAETNLNASNHPAVEDTAVDCPKRQEKSKKSTDQSAKSTSTTPDKAKPKIKAKCESKSNATHPKSRSTTTARLEDSVTVHSGQAHPGEKGKKYPEGTPVDLPLAIHEALRHENSQIKRVRYNLSGHGFDFIKTLRIHKMVSAIQILFRNTTVV